MRSAATWTIAGLVAAACIAYIAASFQWRSIAESLRQCDPIWFFGGGMMSLFAYWLLRSIRWLLLLRLLGSEISLSNAYFSSAVSLGLSLLTPFQSGEALKVELLKRSGLVERGTGYGAFASERVMDLAVVFGLGALALVMHLQSVEIARSLVVWLVGLLALMILGVYVMKRILLHWRLEAIRAQLTALSARPVQLINLLIITLIAWLVVAAGWYACFRSIGIDVGMWRSVEVTALATIVNILSLIPGAVGISEVSISELLIRSGIDIPQAQSAALAVRGYGVLAIVLGAAHLPMRQWFRLR